MKKYIVALSLAILALVGCKKNNEGNGKITYRYEGTETFEVASEKGIYFSFGDHNPCTMLRKEGTDKWFSQPVIGFLEYEEGYEYVITADRYRAIVPKDLIVDGPLHHYELKEIVSKIQRDTEDISWALPYYDSWGQDPIEWPVLSPEELTVIRTVAELEALIGEADAATKSALKHQHSILLVSGTSDYGIHKIEKQLTYKGGGNYLFEIDITQTFATVIEPWTVAVLVPAIPEGANITLSVDI